MDLARGFMTVYVKEGFSETSEIVKVMILQRGCTSILLATLLVYHLLVSMVATQTLIRNVLPRASTPRDVNLSVKVTQRDSLIVSTSTTEETQVKGVVSSHVSLGSVDTPG